MKLLKWSMIMVMAVLMPAALAEPEISFSGYLDSDVWNDFAGNFYTNDELDLGMSVAFTDKISANIYSTIAGGAVPARMGEPGKRWVSLAFDGVDITFETSFGSFSVGDLVYQHGCFNYYFYKRGSMITPESFARGIQYSIGSDKIEQTILVGAADEADVLFSHEVVTTAGDTLAVEDGVASDANAGDIGGITALTFSDAASLSLFYGTRADVKKGFKATGLLYAGLEANVAAGDAFELKADIGMQNFVNDDAATSDVERAITVPILLEPSLSLGKFSAALTGYYVIDGDETGSYMDAGEQMFVYLEPGFSFNDYVAAGLPLEIHAMGKAEDLSDNGEFWVVPTFYAYPAEGMEWWFWGGAYVPLGAADPYYGIGSELIVEF